MADDVTIGTGYYSNQDGVDVANGRSIFGVNGYWNWFLGIGTSPNTKVTLVTDTTINGVTYKAGEYTIDNIYYQDPTNKTGITLTLQGNGQKAVLGTSLGF